MSQPIDIPPDDDKNDLADAYESLEDITQYSFDDVGGLNSVKQEMQHYAQAIAKPNTFKKYGIRPPKGIILYGPPGMGKTLLARCFASEVGKYIDNPDTSIVFTQLNLEQYVSMWLGQTSKNLDKMLGIYKKIVNANRRKGVDLKIVLYLDEMEAIGAKRDGTHEAYQKMLGVLLKYMDGLDANDGIYWIGSTNRVNTLDEALTRPGRFDKLISVDRYDEGGVKEIYQIHMMKATEKSEFDALFDIKDWSQIEYQSRDMSGAEVAEIVRRCVEYALWRDVDKGESKIPLQEKHVLKEIELFYDRRKKKLKPKRKIGFVPDATESKPTTKPKTRKKKKKK